MAPLGFSVNYPPGCKELSVSLKLDELRKRLNDLSNGFDKLADLDTFSEDTPHDTEDAVNSPPHESFRGLALLLISPEYTQHADTDIQLRVGVCLCKLLKLFCPRSPFEEMLEEKELTKKTLIFLLNCIQRLSSLKSKGDVAYPKLHAILYLCCQMDLFLWCSLADDEEILLKCIQTTLSIIKNLPAWAWTEPSFVRQMLLDMVVNIIVHSENLLSRDIVTYLLEFLIEPAKSAQPEQHAFARDIILRSSRHLEYLIQMLLQSSLISGSEQPRDPSADLCHTDSPCDALTNPATSNGTPEDSSSHGFGEHAFLIIYALHKIQHSLIAPVLPTVELRLKSPSARDRKRAFRLLARLFSEQRILLHEQNPSLWNALLGRFNDIDKEVRKLCILMVPQMIKQNPDLPRHDLIQCVRQRAYDLEQDVRLLVLRTVAILVNESPSDIADDLFELIKERSRDKDFSIRKEAATALASVYKHSIKEEPLPYDRCATALNAIMHMYYNPSLDDRIIVERLFKSSLVPYHSSTNDRVRALFTFYNIVDEASVKATQELFKAQFTAISLLRDVVHLLAIHEGQTIPPDVESELIDRLQHLAGLLPKSDKSLEHLKRFFNQAHLDKSLLAQLTRLTKPNCGCAQATSCMREILKRVDRSSTGKAPTADAQLNYVRSIKVLLERSAPVLFDREFGQELVTQMVVVRETESTSGLTHPFDLTRSLRLLYSLTVYFKRTLPTDEVMDYLVGILAHQPVMLEDSASAKGSHTSLNGNEQDPLTVQELALYILCWLMGGSNGLSDGDIQTQSRPVTRVSVTQFGGSEANLNERAADLLPLLSELCCNGMTFDFPPVPCCSGSGTQPVVAHTGARLNKAKTARGVPKQNTDSSSDASPISTDLYMAGLAWRRERRRAKLATQILLCMRKLAFRFRVNAYKASSLQPCVKLRRIDSVDEVDLDAGSVDAVDTTTSGDMGVPSPLERAIQSALDKVVENCLSCPTHSGNYVTCLTTLSRIALQLPLVYNREFKKLITKTLVQHVLARDEFLSSNFNDSVDGDTGVLNPPHSGEAHSEVGGNVSVPEPKVSSDWLHDGHIPLLTRIKISAVKFMTNWLRGLKNEVKVVAQAVIRLLHRIIIHDGDLTRQGKLSAGEMSRMRLVAAQAWLKLAHSQSYVENIEVDWYQSMTYIICDPCPQVRSRFLMKLNQGLYRLRLPLEYMAMFAHAADVPDSAFKQRAKQFLHGNIQRRRDFLNRHPSYLKDAKFLYGLLPDFVLPYLIYLLAHDPQWSHPYDVNRLNRVKASLWFVMEPVVTRGHNFVFLRKIIEKIKHTRDALAPDNALMNMKLYITCDIALGLLLTRSSDLTIKEYPVDVKLPKALFCAAPSDFKNPDFAQLLGPAIEHTRTHAGTSNGETIGVRQPLIQFTPSKSARLLKDTLMPAELLKERRQGATALKTSAVDSTSVDPSLPPNAGKPGHSTANASQLPRDRHVLEPNEADSSAILTDNEIPRSIDLDEVPDPNLTTQSSSRSIPTTQSTISSAQSSVDKRAPAPKLEPHVITGCGRKRKRRQSSANVTLKNLLKSPKKSPKTAAAPGAASSPATMQSIKNVRVRHASQSTHINTSITTVSRKTTPGSNLPGVKKNNQLSADNLSTRLYLRKSDSQPSVKKRGRTPISADPKRPKLEGPSTLEIGRKVSRRSSQSKPSRTSNMTRGRKK